MATIKKGYLDSPEGQIHYRFTTNEPTKSHPILYLHASASSSASGEKLMRYFAAQGYKCYAPDMPGFGQSFDPPSDPSSLAWYVDNYLHIFTSNPDFADGCHVVGHHSGSPIGVELAVARPAFVRTLTMLGPVVMPNETRSKMLATAAAAFNEPVADGSHLTKTWEYLQQPGRVPASEIELLQRETLDHVRAWKGRLQAYKCVFSHNGFDMLPRVSCPVLALCAPDDVLWSSFRFVQEVKPDVQVAEVTGGINAPDMGTESVARELEKFLQAAA